MTAPVLFPNATQLSTVLPIRAWRVLGALSVVTALGLVALLVINPARGLLLFWGVLLPMLPVVFLTAPGAWRNLCPMATLNQAPRLLGLTRGLTHTPRIREYSYVVGIALFIALASSRKWLFDNDAGASALLILFGLGGALAGGLVFKGKSGWCSSICPLLPVQRLYGQTPFKLIGNAHCQPCVGCTKNCYDFNPGVAYLVDQDDPDRHYVAYRRLFAALLPGFVTAFFLIPRDATPSTVYFTLAVYAAASIATFTVLDTFLKLTTNRLTVLFGATAFALYYWFVADVWLRSLATVTGGWAVPAGAPWAVRVVTVLVAVTWVVRSFRIEDRYREQLVRAPATQPIKLGTGAAVALRRMTAEFSTRPSEVVIAPENRRLPAEEGQSLLELIEGCGARIEVGCRMGVCGADPVAVKDGMHCLSPVGDDERNTLERLGLASNTRLACSARMRGGVVTVALTPDKSRGARSSLGGRYDPAIRDVVVIGNGIAGVTAADHLRRRHPMCSIRIVAEENHHLYNRMGITRLIYGRSAMQGLYLMPESWYADRSVDVLLNTGARRIDAATREVELADGERLRYDRLILATGSSSFVPPIAGYGGDGCFVLRTANDAMGLRAYAHRTGARHAVVAGGGLLGLEAAYALHKLGCRVTVIERAAWLLPRQLDERGAGVLQAYLEGMGLQILTGVQLEGLVSHGLGREARLADGRLLRAELFVVAAGIAPNVALAREAGLAVKRGVVVDAAMRTSDRVIFAAGDVAEFDGRIVGLWPIAVEQAEVAACNALGTERHYAEPVLSTILKVVGADVLSVGRVVPTEGDETVVEVEEENSAYRYRKLVIRNDCLVGAILIGWPELSESVAQAVKAGAPANTLSPPLYSPRRSGRVGVSREAVGISL
jgi:nitrite reductase (NADH) large subunit